MIRLGDPEGEPEAEAEALRLATGRLADAIGRRSIMILAALSLAGIGSLHEANTGKPTFLGTTQSGVHETSSNCRILYLWIDGDRADAGNQLLLPHEITSDYLPINLRDDRVNVFSR